MLCTSASARERVRDITALQSEEPSLGSIVFCLKVACCDWSGSVRAAALNSFAALGERYKNSECCDKQSLTTALSLLDDSFRDTHVPARVAAYHALARVSPTDDAFRLVCAQLAVETDAIVRAGALDAIASLPTPVHTAALLTSLCRDTSTITMDAALSAGEFGGVLADAADDPDARVATAALRAISRASREATDARVLTEVTRAAASALRLGAAATRAAALRMLESAPAALTLDTGCAAGVAREVDNAEHAPLAVAALRGRRCGGLAPFTLVLRQVERVLACARGGDDAAAAALLAGAKEELVAMNGDWARVADLGRRPSDKLIPHWV